MSLTTEAYYDKVDCNIPAGTYNTIQDHIDRYERDILIRVLGYDLYKLVAAYTAESDQIIIDLVEGKEYTEGAYTVKWNGLLNAEKVSPLAFAVYAEWLKNLSTVQNVGVVQAAVENGTLMSIAMEIQRATANARALFGYVGQDAYAGSLYNFLVKHSSDYPTWIWNEYEMNNAFGL